MPAGGLFKLERAEMPLELRRKLWKHFILLLCKKTNKLILKKLVEVGLLNYNCLYLPEGLPWGLRG